jgi:thymidylate kinase
MGTRKLFVALEGLDGVGKSTLGKELAQRLNGTYFHTPAEPFQSIRRALDGPASPQTRILFFLSSVSHASQQIEDLLIHTPVVCDRYIASTIAYQVAMDKRLLEITDTVSVLQPDFTFYLYADESVRRLRLTERSAMEGTYTDQLLEDGSYMARVDGLYRAQPGIQMIDTTEKSVDELAEQLMECICGIPSSV